MGKAFKLELSERFIDYLENIPESGMGYHLIDVELTNGTILKNRLVYNSSILKLDSADEIINDDIKNLSISK